MCRARPPLDPPMRGVADWCLQTDTVEWSSISHIVTNIIYLWILALESIFIHKS